MSAVTLNTRHRVTGALQRLTEDQIRPFKDYLEIVPDDAKPLTPGLFKPGKVDEDREPAQSRSVEDLQRRYDAVLENHAPNSKVARAAKKHLDEARAEAEERQEAADQANAAIQEGDDIDPEVAEVISSRSEGDE